MYDEFSAEQNRATDLAAQNEALTEQVKKLETEYAKMSNNYQAQIAKDSNKYKSLKIEYKNLNKEYMEIRSKLNVTSQELNVTTLQKNELADELIITENIIN